MKNRSTTATKPSKTKPSKITEMLKIVDDQLAVIHQKVSPLMQEYFQLKKLHNLLRGLKIPTYNSAEFCLKHFLLQRNFSAGAMFTKDNIRDFFQSKDAVISIFQENSDFDSTKLQNILRAGVRRGVIRKQPEKHGYIVMKLDHYTPDEEDIFYACNSNPNNNTNTEL